MKCIPLLGSLALGLSLHAQSPRVPGYEMGAASLSRSPLTVEDLHRMEEAMLFSDEDVKYLRMSKPILADQTDAILDVWYGFVASKPQLLDAFVDRRTGKPDGAYLAAVRKRFGQWILDTADARYDQGWLDWQQEIGRRHARAGKNRTDHAHAAPVVPFRYLAPLVIPVVTTLKPFLAKKGASPEEVEKMQQAWLKATLLQVTLWSQPYVRKGDY